MTRAPLKLVPYDALSLMEGTSYEWRVIAENARGESEPSEPCQFIAKDPWSKPGPPDAPVVSNIKATSVDLSWSPPKSDGGATIQCYTVEYKAVTQHRWIKSADEVTDTNHRVSGIVEGYDYEFRVAATNKAGTGAFSEPSKSVLVKEKIGK